MPQPPWVTALVTNSVTRRHVTCAGSSNLHRATKRRASAHANVGVQDAGSSETDKVSSDMVICSLWQEGCRRSAFSTCLQRRPPHGFIACDSDTRGAQIRHSLIPFVMGGMPGSGAS